MIRRNATLGPTSMTIIEQHPAERQKQHSDITPPPRNENDLDLPPACKYDPPTSKSIRVSRTVRIIPPPVAATAVLAQNVTCNSELGNTTIECSERQQQHESMSNTQSGCCQGGPGSYFEDRCQMPQILCCAITITMAVLFIVGLILIGSDDKKTEEEWEQDEETTMGDFDAIGKTGLVLCLFVAFFGVFCAYRFVCINLVPDYGGWRSRGELRRGQQEVDSDLPDTTTGDALY